MGVCCCYCLCCRQQESLYFQNIQIISMVFYILCSAYVYNMLCWMISYERSLLQSKSYALFSLLFIWFSFFFSWNLLWWCCLFVIFQHKNRTVICYLCWFCVSVTGPRTTKIKKIYYEKLEINCHGKYCSLEWKSFTPYDYYYFG